MKRIPRSWKEVTLKQYIELELLPKYDTDNEEEILKRKITEAHILTRLSVQEIDKMPFGELYEIKRLLDSNKPQRLRRSFKHNGVRYRVQLNPVKLDADKFLSILNLSRKDPIKKTPQILLNVCRPYKRVLFFWRKYYDFEPEEYVKKIEEFEQLPMNIASPILVFFCNLSEKLLKRIQEYSDQQMKKQIKILNKTKAELRKVS